MQPLFTYTLLFKGGNSFKGITTLIVGNFTVKVKRNHTLTCLDDKVDHSLTSM